MKTLIFLITFQLLTWSSQAQIFYQDISPDVVLSSWGVKHVHIDSNANSTLPYGAAGIISIWREGSMGPVVVNSFSDCEVLMEGDYPAALNKDLIISSSALWVKPYYALLCNGLKGNWMGVTDKYLGVRIKNGTHWLYGWIRMDVNSAGSTVTIKDYACNRTADAQIIAGQSGANGINYGSENLSDFVLVYTTSPADHITFKLPDSKNKIHKISIFNAKGCLIRNILNIGASSVTIEIPDDPKGIYFYLIQDIKGICYSGKYILK